ncbi:hypothetical protein RN001_007099 [Aquatica leii]|uniref:Mutator-like transposase domain-containing protein n=1 Tax=Aquatica leii TaxID=1421715 RepID=A0AAN7SNR2_9COLE|nr:hypothetical protein RN001_007099 [Aquatica leii]
MGSTKTTDTRQKNNNKKENTDKMEGRRLIDVRYFLENAMNFPHNDLFSYASYHVKIIRGIKKGLISKFVLKCDMCQVEHTVNSKKTNGKLNINGAIVNSFVNIGYGFSQLNELASSLNMP